MKDHLLVLCERIYEQSVKDGNESPMAAVLAELAIRLVPQQRIPGDEYPGLYMAWMARNDIKIKLLRAAGKSYE